MVGSAARFQLSATRHALLAVQRSQQLAWQGVVAECLAHMDKAVCVTRTENEAAAELERILAQPMLAHADGLGAFAGAHVVAAQKMEQVGFFQFDRAVRLALVVNEKRESDAGLLAEVAGVTYIAKADGDQLCPALPKLLLEFAQLRDVLTAEDSTIVAQEHHNCGCIGP
jgi:hypothetical protein